MKKLLSLILVVLMCLGIAIPALAADITESADANENMALFPNSEEMTGIVEAVRTIMSWDSAVSYNKATVEVGERISMYSYEGGQFVEGAPVYPVFNNDVLYTLLLGDKDANKNYFGCIDELVAPMNELLDRNEEFALVFDRRNCYAYDGAEWHLLWVYKSGIEPRGDLDIENCPDTSGIVLNSMEYSRSIVELSAIELSVPQPRVAYFALPLAFVGQDADSICWAACVAAIVNYSTDSDFISLEIAQNYWYGLGQNTWNKGLNIGTIPSVLARYNVSGYSLGSNSGRLPSNLDDMIYNNISNDYPVYATFANDYNNHACVIYGIAPGGNSMLVMNPEMEYSDPYEIGNGNTVFFDKKDGYYISYGGVKLYLDGLCAKIWN